MNRQRNFSYPIESLSKPIANILLVSVIFAGMLIAIVFGGSVAGAGAAQKLRALFALDSVQVWWYVTRAAGLTGYFLLWLSMIWGFVIPTRLFSPALEGTFSYDFHEHLSLLGLGFVVLHVGVLLFDNYLRFNLLQILIPFMDSYRPLWVGLGIISFYILLLVTFTFYLRQHMGVKTFRSIHILSLAGYLGATLHGMFAGTDSALPITMLLYVGTFLVVVFFTTYWLLMRLAGKQEREAVAAQSQPHLRR